MFTYLFVSLYIYVFMRVYIHVYIYIWCLILNDPELGVEISNRQRTSCCPLSWPRFEPGHLRNLISPQKATELSIIKQNTSCMRARACVWWLGWGEYAGYMYLKMPKVQWKPFYSGFNGPLTRCAKFRVAHAPGMSGTFSSLPTPKETAS